MAARCTWVLDLQHNICSIYSNRLIADHVQVLERARAYGVVKILATSGTASECRETARIIDSLPEHLQGMVYNTIGVHPTRCNEFDQHPGHDYMDQLLALVRDYRRHHICAIGEFGLDYDRVQFCSPVVQRKYFIDQFRLVDEVSLPLFLHMRNAAEDFLRILRENRGRFRSGVVHSFTGTSEEARQILELDLYIGINGWYRYSHSPHCYCACSSLKTEENLNVVREIPLDRIMIESDAPWCEIRPSHASATHVQTRLKSIDKSKYDPTMHGDMLVKSRNEPYACRQVLEVIARLHGQSPEYIAELVFSTTNKLFGI